MRDNSVGLSARAAKFVALVAAGQHSITECHSLAGYSGRDSGNASKLAKHLAAEIQAERERLGIAEPEANAGIEDDSKAQHIADLRRVYAMAIERGETGAAVKALRGIERLLKPKRPPGRPAVATAPAPMPRENMFANMPPEEFAALVDLILELPEIESDESLCRVSLE